MSNGSHRCRSRLGKEKLVYASHWEASSAAISFAARYNRSHLPYHCECGLWHLTTKPLPIVVHRVRVEMNIETSGPMEYRWACSCGDAGQWSTKHRLARSGGRNHENEHEAARDDPWPQPTLPTLPRSKAMSRPRNLRKPTPRRCAAYWDDYIAAWRAVGAAAYQHLDDPGPPDDVLAAMIEAALNDPTRRFMKPEEIGPWLESIRAEEVDPGVFVIESTDDDDDRPF